MFTFTLAFLFGDMLAQQLTMFAWLILLLPSMLGVTQMKQKTFHLGYILFAFIFGLTYTAWYKHHILSWSLPQEQEGVPVRVVGDVVSIPQSDHRQTKFNFLIHSNAGSRLSPGRQVLVQLYWRVQPAKLQVGDSWQLLVKLKRIHGVHNPGSFDYEAWALQQGLRASGSVISSKQNIKLAHHWYVHPVDQIRQAILEKLKHHLPHSTTSHWLIALAIGERADIPQEQWQVLRHTGTNHLMAIGGLHIGMVAGFVLVLLSWCWRRVPSLMLRQTAHEASAAIALLVAWLYGALSGFALPAQRACLMLSVYTLAVLSRRKINSWQVWSLAMLIVLIVNPLSVLSESFWLSFGTIALIIFGMSVRVIPAKAVILAFAGMTASTRMANLWWKWGRVQWVIGFGLLPFSILFFHETSLASFAANSIAIPWLGCLILPFCLFGTLFVFIIPPLGDLLLLIADKTLAILWLIMEWIAHWHIATWSQAMPNSLIFMLALCGILLLITPLKFPAKWLGIIWLAPLLLYKPPLLPAGTAKVTLLDVGQGLSVVVQTREHVLVFDAGPPSPSVVVPFLQTQFVKQIDMLVISHGDLDHIGGAGEILRDMLVNQISTSVPERFLTRAAALCLVGQHWEWDGVSFSFIYPYPDTLHLGNDSSCVLRVDAGRDSVLIPGDIEKFAEQVLVERASSSLRATTLVAPHHGSHTSGLPDFINAVYPRYVMYATGYRNRYHFPHRDIVDSYRAIHAESFDTAENGAVRWVMGHPL